jgi:hypothetical protein
MEGIVKTAASRPQTKSDPADDSMFIDPHDAGPGFFDSCSRRGFRYRFW